MNATVNPETAICPRCGRTLANCICEEDFSFARPMEKPEAEAEEQTEKVTLIVGALLFIGVELYHTALQLPDYPPVLLGLLVAAFVILGRQVLWTACKNLLHGDIFDENFLMSVATLGAFAIHQYPEAVGVMLFFRIGEMFEDVAVARSRSHPGVRVGLSPRAGLALLRAARAHALLLGRGHALPEDVQALFVPVAAHRLVADDQTHANDGRILAKAIMQAVAVD